MRDLNLDNITATAVDSFAGLADARQRELVQTLVRHLHAYAREVKLTHAEWRAAIAFLHRVGDISSEQRSEFSLLSDVTGLSSLVDLLGSHPQAIKDAVLDFWQNAANGLYWQLDAAQPRDNLRCQLRVDAQGGYEIATIRPVPYQIPTDGPAWVDLVEPAGRGSWRPAHFHLIVSAPGHRTLVTELFDAEDPYLDRDAVFGVREALIGRYAEEHDLAAAQRLGLPGPGVPVMRMDFRLAPA
ncbi:MAG: 6-chlorohydroxyquinol-1,2-dioxygenase [Rubrivivax sp.]|nr:6-chlorohydroxyquinol-1,2-dioxygenase [Rubrivivax sp.]